MDPAAWIRTHKPAAAAGAVGLVVVFALYRRRQSANGSTGTSALGGGTISGGGTAFDSSQLDQYNQLASAISNLNDQVGTIKSGSAAGSVGTVGTGPTNGLHPVGVGKYVGSGYLPDLPGGVAYSTKGQKFEYISTAAQLTNILKAGGKVYAEIAPGLFVPSQGVGVQQKFLPGTPQYVQV